MATLLSCPSCHREIQVPDSLLGGAVRCPACRIIFNSGANGSVALPSVPTPYATPLEEVSPPPGDAASSSIPPEDARVLEDPRGEFFACTCCAEIIPGHANVCPFCGETVLQHKRWLRRDVVSHRGGLILVLGIVSLVCVPGIVATCLVGPLFNLVGIGLGTAAWVMGNRDLARIMCGDMDPDGQIQTKSGRNCGIIGVVLNILCLLGCAGLFGVLFLANHRGRW
jgi:hypothetical protein